MARQPDRSSQSVTPIPIPIGAEVTHLETGEMYLVIGELLAGPRRYLRLVKTMKDVKQLVVPDDTVQRKEP